MTYPIELTPEEQESLTTDQKAALDAIGARMEALTVLEKAFKRKEQAKGFEEIQEYCDLLSYLAEIVVEKHHDLEKKWSKVGEELKELKK